MTHVLLIDDEEALRASLSYALVKEGYKVTTAADGQTALKLFHKQVNAIKHSVPDSMVFVSGKIEAIQVAVQIRDRGPGIEESDLPRIFEQFYTADPSRKGSGTGLGLAIARRIVETHGGSITASNTATGKGATFTIRLPLNTPSRILKTNQ